MFSVTLQWRTHYENITAKAYKVLGLLHKIFKNSISFEVLFIILLTLVAALFNSRHYTAGKGAMMSNQVHIK